MPLFGRLAERELMRVMQVAEVRPFEPDATVIKEGDRGDELFIVLSGQVKVLKGDAVLTTLGRGEHFGEMALIRSQPRSADVVSEGKSEIIAIRRSDFFEILRTEHEMAVKLLWQFLGVLADRLYQTSKDLRSAREEIDAEDITAEIFPDVEPLPSVESLDSVMDGETIEIPTAHLPVPPPPTVVEEEDDDFLMSVDGMEPIADLEDEHEDATTPNNECPVIAFPKMHDKHEN
ncbi:MAG: hypothetical protein CSA75_05055 [Sorangium cellulosum]|nr:MAG: hypothetical protein CSA75_05055 [Sorangium cellulosum]